MLHPPARIITATMTTSHAIRLGSGSLELTSLSLYIDASNEFHDVSVRINAFVAHHQELAANSLQEVEVSDKRKQKVSAVHTIKVNLSKNMNLRMYCLRYHQRSRTQSLANAQSHDQTSPRNRLTCQRFQRIA
mmetsp:Transcript_9537/g.15880  ORF Transcript_9537/g.15880 Transcript_9537/m.15880 type:complete len:133 (-) Transcript_9537:574-972(-)